MIKDLQRRLDCTVGKPGTFIKRGQARPVTVAARLSRLENMVGGVVGLIVLVVSSNIISVLTLDLLLIFFFS